MTDTESAVPAEGGMREITWDELVQNKEQQENSVIQQNSESQTSEPHQSEAIESDTNGNSSVKTGSAEELDSTEKSSAQINISEETLFAILAKEVDPEMDAEMLEAQAVIVRTNYMYNLLYNKTQTAGLGTSELMELWGQQKYTRYFNKLKKSLTNTEDEILVCNNLPAQLEYHRVSAGITRVGEENGLSGRPYLANVESKQDITSQDFLKVMFFTTEEFYRKCSLFLAKEDEAKSAEELVNLVQIKARDTAGYAVTVQLGEREMTGEEFRQLLGLNSACFYIKAVDDQIRIVSKGYGHGFGLSQYGTEQLVKEGRSYQEVLQNYFPGTEQVRVVY